MLKLIGFCEMKKTDGKVLFLVDDYKSEKVVGQTCKTEYLYGDVSHKINSSCVGKEISLLYGRGYNGKAFVTDITIK